MRSDEVYLRHILDAINTIAGYLNNVSREHCMAAKLLQDGVIREFEIIDEAVKNVSDTYKQGRPQVSWKDFAGMRDKLIHQYFGVNLGAVWETVKEDVPRLKSALQSPNH